MNASLVWKARPIFLSSTFRDMGAERDWLRANAFLRLGEQLRERCHYLDTIDLRQGVETASETDDAKREMQVLKAYREDRAITSRLAAADPSKAGWQRDLFVSYCKMAGVAEETGNGDARDHAADG